MPVELRAVVEKRLHDAETAALTILGDKIVTDARSRAPVRKLERQGRKKFGPPAGLSLEVRRFVRSQRSRMTPSQFQAFQYAVTHGRTVVTRKARKRQPLVLGSYVSGKVTKPQYGRTLQTPRNALREVIRPHTYNREFVPAKGVQVQRLFGRGSRIKGGGPQFQPLNEFASRFTAAGRYEIKSGRATFLNAAGQYQVGGKLKASIEVINDPAEGRIVVEADPVDNNGHHYARYVEFPTSRTAAQPFLLPALKNVRRFVRPVFEKALRDEGLKG